MGAIAQQQRADDVVSYSSNEAANCGDEQSTADMSGKRQPKRGRHPYQRGTYDGNQGKESNEYAPENCRADSGKSKGKSAKGALNGSDQQANRDASENEFSRFAHHVFLNGCVKRQEMAHRAGNVFTVAKHKKESEQEHEQVQEKRKDISHEATYLGGQESSYSFGSAPGGIGQIHVLQGIR